MHLTTTAAVPLAFLDLVLNEWLHSVTFIYQIIITIRISIISNFHNFKIN